MKQVLLTVKNTERLTESVWRCRLCGDVSAVTAPGQFVNLRLDGLFLRRPISVCDLDGEAVTIVWKTVGKGTEQLTGCEGQTLDVLTGLGNGYDLSPAGERPLLIGGGVGVPPLYYLCKRLLSEGKRPTVILGFNTEKEIFLEKDFSALGVPVIVATADGSRGVRGFVTDAMDTEAVGEYTHFYTCGPEPMLKAVYRASRTDGQFSFEERMGCGFGACMGCSCKTVTGYKRICRDGPVLRKGEILWEK